ncbi:MAG: adenosylmethionine decarboxylase [Lachnospiraceae bacterium]|nr:adenosylmethionine decarboxylase [Lachnospiraceae bacterium]
MASQLMVDLYDCDEALLDDVELISRIARNMITEIGAQIVEECVHKFQPIGITYIAVITTSHFSIHTWPEYGYAAVDIFSCKEGLPMEIAEKLKEAFGAKKHTVNGFERDIGGRN